MQPNVKIASGLPASEIATDLIRAYLITRFVVFSQPELDLEVGRASPALDGLARR